MVLAVRLEGSVIPVQVATEIYTLAVRLEGCVIPVQVATRPQAERERIATEEARKARIALAVDLQQKAKEVAGPGSDRDLCAGSGFESRHKLGGEERARTG